MTQQIAVITPPTVMTSDAVLDSIRNLLPIEAQHWLTTAGNNGTRNTTIVNDNNTFTVTTQWSDAEALAGYKTVMAGASSDIANAIESDGWTMTLTPLTADL
tara:strand:- start:3898 stop:4203 length:306 start_codon:yes stop_codon:yes gene_type:complete